METPNNTLYINNMYEKLKPEDTRRLLKMLFSEYGKPEKIYVSRRLVAKGQAWITFGDVDSANAAMKAKQGFNFYGKPLKIQYAVKKDEIGDDAPRKRKRDDDEGDDATNHSRR